MQTAITVNHHSSIEILPSPITVSIHNIFIFATTILVVLLKDTVHIYIRMHIYTEADL